jgi:hypothetical protein
MRPRNIICILLLSLVLFSCSVCLAMESASSSKASLAIPKDNLPEGFKLMAALPEMDPSVNMTDYIKNFYGAKDIGQVNVSVGIYQWGTPGETSTYDAKITLLQLQDEMHAEAAVSNFMALPEFEKPPFRGVDRFSSAIINGHNTTEIRRDVGETSLRFLYLWSNGNTAILVEGNGDAGKSRELASATGL